jgi:ribosomal protein S18 acetylase RimI-like enzyme
VDLRPFAPPDLDAVMALVSETFQQLFSPEMYIALHQAWPSGQLLMVGSGRLVGVLLSMKRTSVTARVLVMALREEDRGKGIGSRLLRAFLLRCGQEGISSVVLEVRRSNNRAIEFYTRFGFRVVGPLPGYYPDGENGVMMMRDVV